ncbi:hypothetical protein O9G_004076 [Rozella allomycis CSF55]|uniref:FANCL UBC-like domain-containing protein n=1 Tax=Rozella allomycis (strain CSF55) TaxID=988480 RepID=A0A075B2M8_ROZAC|nr:hypothetical protein O9G_004076 [Rozella allomycis CSF55]|eukprot:EPZ35058.1 hypothetical protein O9G_004076 [Rozella allomycis CSF55]
MTQVYLCPLNWKRSKFAGYIQFQNNFHIVQAENTGLNVTFDPPVELSANEIIKILKKNDDLEKGLLNLCRRLMLNEQPSPPTSTDKRSDVEEISLLEFMTKAFPGLNSTIIENKQHNIIRILKNFGSHEFELDVKVARNELKILDFDIKSPLNLDLKNSSSLKDIIEQFLYKTESIKPLCEAINKIRKELGLENHNASNTLEFILEKNIVLQIELNPLNVNGIPKIAFSGAGRRVKELRKKLNQNVLKW